MKKVVEKSVKDKAKTKSKPVDNHLSDEVIEAFKAIAPNRSRTTKAPDQLKEIELLKEEYNLLNLEKLDIEDSLKLKDKLICELQNKLKEKEELCGKYEDICMSLYVSVKNIQDFGVLGIFLHPSKVYSHLRKATEQLCGRLSKLHCKD